MRPSGHWTLALGTRGTRPRPVGFDVTDWRWWCGAARHGVSWASSSMSSDQLAVDHAGAAGCLDHGGIRGQDQRKAAHSGPLSQRADHARVPQDLPGEC